MKSHCTPQRSTVKSALRSRLLHVHSTGPHSLKMVSNMHSGGTSTFHALKTTSVDAALNSTETIESAAFSPAAQGIREKMPQVVGEDRSFLRVYSLTICESGVKRESLNPIASPEAFPRFHIDVPCTGLEVKNICIQGLATFSFNMLSMVQNAVDPGKLCTITSATSFDSAPGWYRSSGIKYGPMLLLLGARQSNYADRSARVLCSTSLLSLALEKEGLRYYSMIECRSNSSSILDPRCEEMIYATLSW